MTTKRNTPTADRLPRDALDALDALDRYRHLEAPMGCQGSPDHPYAIARVLVLYAGRDVAALCRRCTTALAGHARQLAAELITLELPDDADPGPVVAAMRHHLEAGTQGRLL